MNEFKGFGHVSIIVPAAGSGSRTGAGTPKQYLKVLGKPLLEHTLTRLISLGAARVVLVVAEGDLTYRDVPGHEQCEVVVGGETRARSVLNALNALVADENDWVLVHDGARPCVRPKDIVRLIETVAGTDESVGGLLAVRAIDTIKRVAEGNVQATLDRSEVWFAQTPQMFKLGLLKRAMQNALDSGATITDESSAIEKLGYKPLIVEGHTDNIKVTTAEDLDLVAFLLSRQDLNKQDQS